MLEKEPIFTVIIVCQDGEAPTLVDRFQVDTAGMAALSPMIRLVKLPLLDRSDMGNEADR